MYGFGTFSAHTRNIPALEFPTSIPRFPSISEHVSTHTRSPIPRETTSVTRADTSGTRPDSTRAADASRRTFRGESVSRTIPWTPLYSTPRYRATSSGVRPTTKIFL